MSCDSGSDWRDIAGLRLWPVVRASAADLCKGGVTPAKGVGLSLGFTALINSLKTIFAGERSRRGYARRRRAGTLGLLTPEDFRYEVRMERLRADRRGIPFCVVRLALNGRNRRRGEMRRLTNLILRNVRATDEKSVLGRYVLALLLVDTAEMGGRTVLDRLEDLALRSGFDVKISLRTYDPEAFGDDQNEPPADFDENNGSGHGDTKGDGIADEIGKQSSVRLAPAVVKSAGTVGTAVGTAVGTVALASGRKIRIDHPVSSEYIRTSLFSAFLKRSIDISAASVGLIIAAPVLAASAIAIRLDSKGSPLFSQMREGRGGTTFRIYKLRTMHVDAETRQAALRELSERDGPAFKMKDDPRVTRVGRFLRSTCIDELPQLLNVLKGDMSIVGPRPLPVAESRACEAWHRRRLDVRPGLTCDWQINKRSAETFDDWMRLDLAYVDRGGVIRDLWLMVQTLRVPIGGRGGD